MATIQYLYSSTPSTVALEKHQDFFVRLLESKKLAHEKVDGANADNKDLRTQLWAISAPKRGYPMFFKKTAGSTVFVGDYDTVFDAVEVEEFDAMVADVKKV